MKCRHCKENLKHDFLDLGSAPPSNAYLEKNQLTETELYFPLRVKVCESCWLVQTEDYTDADKLFDSEYAYFSSTSQSFLEHAASFSNKIIDELNLNSKSFIVEIASNDGYLLKNFVKKNIPCLGIEPTDSTADASEKLNIPTLREFFSQKLSKIISNDYGKADLIVGNNVFAHVPDINDFTLGIADLLSEDGVVTLEFPQLLSTMKGKQFDQIYHEHFSYLSLTAVETIFNSAGLKIWKVEELKTHGGSLRVYGCRYESTTHHVCQSVNDQLDKEEEFGLKKLETYSNFQLEAEKIKDNFLNFLNEQNKIGKTIAAYGAAAKGNTLLNFAGIQNNLIEFVCDAAPSKQNKYMPGSHIPILHPSNLQNIKVDYVLILPWNIAKEITEQLSYLRKNGTKFVIAIPELLIF